MCLHMAQKEASIHVYGWGTASHIGGGHVAQGWVTWGSQHGAEEGVEGMAQGRQVGGCGCVKQSLVRRLEGAGAGELGGSVQAAAFEGW